MFAVIAVDAEQRYNRTKKHPALEDNDFTLP